MITQEFWMSLCTAQIGKPYVWGADGPDAFDCSGFVQWALRQLDLDPPGDQTAEGLYRYFLHGKSRPIQTIESRVGDLVFFGHNDAVTHVALAWGDGNMLEAGGGGRTTTSKEIAKQQHAEIKISKINRRHDLLSALRLNGIDWATTEQGGRALAGRMMASTDYYEGLPIIATPLKDGRHIQLERPISFVQANGTHWPVPAGTIVDGTSIPSIFWSVMGGSFEGRFRNASIIHDYYCDIKSRPWKDTHRAFYDGMICSQVSTQEAKIMYYAVYRFGPRWEVVTPDWLRGLDFVDASEAIPIDLPANMFNSDEFKEDIDIILIESLNADQIENLADNRTS